jgi:hypothetical protein
MRRRRGATGLLLAVLVAGAAAGCELIKVDPPPLPMGTAECIEIPEPTCEEILDGRINARAPVKLVGYQVRCKVDSCTTDVGEAEANLTWADGQTEIFSYTWFGPTQ